MDKSRYRRLCTRWPGTALDVKWGDALTATVDGKMFALWRLGGPNAGQLWFKVDDHRFLELTDQAGLSPAPYLARAKWIQVEEPERFDDEWLAHGIRRAYELVAAKLSRKRQRELGIEPASL